MHVSYRADNHFQEDGRIRSYNAMGNVRGQDTANVWPNYRNLERDKRIRERVEVTAPPAPGVGQAHIGARAQAIVSGDVSWRYCETAVFFRASNPPPPVALSTGSRKKRSTVWLSR